MKRFAAFCSLFLLTACVSSGTLVTSQQAAQFQRGRTTRAEVIGTLGAPSSTFLSDNGGRIDGYTHIQGRQNIANYIPVVDVLFGGATGATETATFVYDRNGVLSEVSSGGGAIDLNTGWLNQSIGTWTPTALPVAAQPARVSDVTGAPAAAPAARPAPMATPVLAPAPRTLRRACTPRESAQRRDFVPYGPTALPDCQ